MEHIKLPEDWYGSLNEWDKNIQENYPYYCPLPKSHFNEFDIVISYFKTVCGENSFTWKGPKFFFKNKEDALLFKMRCYS